MSKFVRALGLTCALAVLAGGTVAVSEAQDPKTKKADDKKADDKKAGEKKTDDKKTAEKKPAAKGGTFEMYKDKSGKFRFRIKDGDGAQLAMSHIGHAAKEDCMAAIDAIKAVAATAKVVEEKD